MLPAAVTLAHRAMGSHRQDADRTGEPDKLITLRHVATSWSKH